MRSSRRALALCLLALIVPAEATLGSRQVFRAATDLVTVEVSVRSGRSLVRGLTTADFELLDNGVRQEIEPVSVELVPIDLTLILDTSGSTSDVIDRFKSRAQQVADMLRKDDRLRLITFATDVIEVFPLRPGEGKLPIDNVKSSGYTSLHDALILSLVRASDPDRRNLIIAFTDGMDTSSAADAATVAAVARRTEGVLHLVLSGGSVGLDGPPTGEALRAAAEETGGEMHRPGAFEDAVDAFKQVFEDFKQSYVLRYTLRNVKREGWHDITVRLTKRDADRYTIRASKGYFGG